MTNPRKYRDKIKIQEEKMKQQRQEYERTMQEMAPIIGRRTPCGCGQALRMPKSCGTPRSRQILNDVIELDLQRISYGPKNLLPRQTGFTRAFRFLAPPQTLTPR
ncbi:hypothetical protein ZHAS_00005291 [Anopheles sinensis]|uniref:Uncharacterized protein n=1 Tax=Anopheles sinensis TaxID=74873 RepID=A0A084VJ80_ANOSI|nr:hypothetical protein ZHAS_00005291 [Anopheles sinensis]